MVGAVFCVPKVFTVNLPTGCCPWNLNLDFGPKGLEYVDVHRIKEASHRLSLLHPTLYL